jgi:hypothetical protein
VILEFAEVARANATCSAREISWSRKNSTLCRNSSVRMSCINAASREAAPRSPLVISAPIAQVRGTTFRIAERIAGAATSGLPAR